MDAADAAQFTAPPPEFSLLDDDLVFRDVAAAFALPTDRVDLGDDAFVDSLLQLDDDAAVAPTDEFEAALLTGELLLDAARPRSSLHAPSPTNSIDDASDAATDVASEMSSPPPALDAEDKPVTPYSPSPTAFQGQSWTPKRLAPASPPVLAHLSSSGSVKASTAMAPSTLAPVPLPANVLPYALPIAYFPAAALNANQKRPLSEVLPSAAATGAVGSCINPAEACLSDADGAGASKKSKREIRQMKNRESANKSRLRRKAQLSELTSEVAGLKKKEQELQMVIAGLRAENKSLQKQNDFLQSLVTNVKREAPMSTPAVNAPLLLQQQSTKHLAVYDHHPSMEASMPSFIALPVIDTTLDNPDEDAIVELDTRSTKRKRSSLASLTTASAATLTMCASVFGITLLADYDGEYTSTSHIRRSGRVLHEAPPMTSLADHGCSSDGHPSFLRLAWDKLLLSWEMVSSSELAYGVLLNVLSFVVIMALYHWWTRSGTTSKGGKQRSRRRGCSADCGKKRGANFSTSKHGHPRSGDIL